MGSSRKISQAAPPARGDRTLPVPQPCSSTGVCARAVRCRSTTSAGYAAVGSGAATRFSRPSSVRGRLVLLVHGIYAGASSYEFRKIAPLLAKRHRVIAFDLLGCGLSEMPDLQYSAPSSSSNRSSTRCASSRRTADPRGEFARRGVRHPRCRAGARARRSSRLELPNRARDPRHRAECRPARAHRALAFPGRGRSRLQRARLEKLAGPVPARPVVCIAGLGLPRSDRPLLRGNAPAGRALRAGVLRRRRTQLRRRARSAVRGSARLDLVGRARFENEPARKSARVRATCQRRATRDAARLRPPAARRGAGEELRRDREVRHAGAPAASRPVRPRCDLQELRRPRDRIRPNSTTTSRTASGARSSSRSGRTNICRRPRHAPVGRGVLRGASRAARPTPAPTSPMSGWSRPTRSTSPSANTASTAAS